MSVEAGAVSAARRHPGPARRGRAGRHRLPRAGLAASGLPRRRCLLRRVGLRHHRGAAARARPHRPHVAARLLGEARAPHPAARSPRHRRGASPSRPWRGRAPRRPPCARTRSTPPSSLPTGTSPRRRTTTSTSAPSRRRCSTTGRSASRSSSTSSGRSSSCSPSPSPVPPTGTAPRSPCSPPRSASPPSSGPWCRRASDPTTAYYSTLTRGWELALGAALATHPGRCRSAAPVCRAAGSRCPSGAVVGRARHPARRLPAAVAGHRRALSRRPRCDGRHGPRAPRRHRGTGRRLRRLRPADQPGERLPRRHLLRPLPLALPARRAGTDLPVAHRMGQRRRGAHRHARCSPSSRTTSSSGPRSMPHGCAHGPCSRPGWRS